MNQRKYILGASIKVARLARMMAKAVDLFIVLLLSFFFFPLGVILGCVYLAVSDSLQSGQSVGKKLFGFAVISLENGTPCTFKQSVIRNLPFLIPTALFIIPIWGIFLGILIGIPLALLELYLLYKLDSGHRLGDVMADTSVLANDGPTKVTMKKPRNSWFQENSPSL